MSSIEHGPSPDELGSLPVESALPHGSALRSALQARLRGGPVDEVDLRRLAGLACEEAHRRGMRAEELVLLLKRTWVTIPETSDRQSTPNKVLERLISICIEHYYRERPPG